MKNPFFWWKSLCHKRAMKIYLGGETPMEKDAGWSAQEGWQPLSKVIKRRMFSFYYHGYQINNRVSKDLKLSIECNMDLFLDSGAFTAHTQNTTIELDRYVDFIQQHGKHF